MTAGITMMEGHTFGVTGGDIVRAIDRRIANLRDELERVGPDRDETVEAIHEALLVGLARTRPEYDRNPVEEVWRPENEVLGLTVSRGTDRVAIEVPSDLYRAYTRAAGHAANITEQIRKLEQLANRYRPFAGRTFEMSGVDIDLIELHEVT